MRLTVFQSDKGDCLLLESKDKKKVLVDGGMAPSFREHTEAALSSKKTLDLVYVSHIDLDHTAGILELLDSIVDWRAFDYQRKSGNQSFPEPQRPRPPKIAEVWHNSYSELTGKRAGPIQDLLAASAAILEGGTTLQLENAARAQRELATGVGEAIELRHRLSPEQLDIPVNRPFGGRLAIAKTPAQTVKLGALDMTVLAPAQVDLEKLRGEWDTWLKENEQQLAELLARMKDDVDRLAANEVEALGLSIEMAATKLGTRSKVTPPNLASLMLLVEEGERSLLLTGDGHCEDILDGLQRAGKVDKTSGLHLNVLKVQHHGSEHNIDEEFCRRITADHYVFCANGDYANPDLAALEAVINSRLGPDGVRSANSEAAADFELWFNSSSGVTRESCKAHMKKVEDLVTKTAGDSDGRMSFFFLEDHSFELPV
jgi:beta-lactamase superfamily II metal-dependent hydrolase